MSLLCACILFSQKTFDFFSKLCIMYPPMILQIQKNLLCCSLKVASAKRATSFIYLVIFISTPTIGFNNAKCLENKIRRRVKNANVILSIKRNNPPSTSNLNGHIILFLVLLLSIHQLYCLSFCVVCECE